MIKILALKKEIKSVEWTGDNIAEIRKVCGRDNVKYDPIDKFLQVVTDEGWEDVYIEDVLVKFGREFDVRRYCKEYVKYAFKTIK